VYGVCIVACYQGFPKSDANTMPQWQESRIKLVHWLCLQAHLIMRFSVCVGKYFQWGVLSLVNWFSIPAQRNLAELVALLATP